MSRALPMTIRPDARRTCGTCTACCTVLGVVELEKPAGVACADIRPAKRDRPTGCSRYETRPETCQVYRCLWLDGLLDRPYRPDKVGLVLDAATGTGRLAAVHERTGIPLMVAREVWPGASRAAAGRTLIEGLARVVGVIVVRHPSDLGRPARVVFGPPPVVAAMAEEIHAATGIVLNPEKGHAAPSEAPGD